MTDSMSQWRTVIALGTSQTLAWGSTYYLPAILADPIATELEVSTSLVFGAFSAALVVGALLGPSVGHWIDTRGGRNVLSLSSLVFVAGLLMLGMSQGVVSLFAAWLVIGVGMAMGLYEAAFSALAGIYRGRARSSITGITLIAGFASTICWPISMVLDAEYGWRITCFFWAFAHLAMGLPINRLLIPRPPEPQVSQPDKSDPSKRPPLSATRETAMILLSLVFAVTWFTSTAMAAHLPRLLQDAGAAPTTAIFAAALVGPAQVAARLFEFGLLRHFHPLVSARLAAVAHPLGGLALLAFGGPAAIVFTIMHGAGNGILTIAKGTLPLSIFGHQGYGLRQGILMVPARFAQAAAPFAFALLIERFGASALYGSMALGVAACIALLALSTTTTGNYQ